MSPVIGSPPRSSTWTLRPGYARELARDVHAHAGGRDHEDLRAPTIGRGDRAPGLAEAHRRAGRRSGARPGSRGPRPVVVGPEHG